MIKRRLRPSTTIAFTLLAIALVIYILRGVGLATFLPGWVIVLLFMVTIGAFIFSAIQGTRR
ncbi:MAG: hypothetical protein MUF49_14990 [Oculatellaceae cyanobacterium Prado106]|nr:hypothetical protein [Oculatellaceae cyanobacterium Prado106]